MDNYASETMIQAVAMAKESAKRAENEYDRGAAEIKRMASKSIDLFGGNAISSVTEIAVKTRKVNDAYYAAYQTLVKMLDDQCRPLLSQNPDPTAIRQVRDTIKWLNDESEIQTTFTASLNGSTRGDVAANGYVPTIENKMIQMFWENTYANHPDRLIAEATLIVKESEEKVKKEELAKKRNEENENRYNRELEAWDKMRAEIQKQRDEEIEKRLKKRRLDRMADVEKRYNDVVKRARYELKNAEKEKEEAEKLLPTLGFFKFSQKKATKETLARLVLKIVQLNNDIEAAEQLYNEGTASVEQWVEDGRMEIDDQARAKYPMPKRPRKPIVSTDPKKIAEEYIRQDIYDWMEPGEKYTIDRLIEEIPSLYDMTNQRVSACIRQMIDVDVERICDKRVAYFRLIEK